jgi:hypothetical protein
VKKELMSDTTVEEVVVSDTTVEERAATDKEQCVVCVECLKSYVRDS